MIKASLTEMGYETILLPYFWSYNAIITGYHMAQGIDGESIERACTRTLGPVGIEI